MCDVMNQVSKNELRRLTELIVTTLPIHICSADCREASVDDIMSFHFRIFYGKLDYFHFSRDDQYHTLLFYGLMHHPHILELLKNVTIQHERLEISTV